MPIRKRVMKKSRKVSRKVNPVKAVTTALSTVTLHHNKLLGSLFDTLYFEAKACREFELSAIPSGTSAGILHLNYNTGTGSGTQFPMHIYDLTAITAQDGNSTYSFQRTLALNSSNNVSFVNFDSPSLYCIGSGDGGTVNSAQNLNKTLMEYANVRLDLYQRDKYTSEYTLQLMKFNDEIIHPDFNNTNIGASNFQQFWKNQIRPTYTNSLIPTDPRIDADLKGKYSILWEKHYKLNEKLNDSDSYKCKRVNIFKKLMKVLRYNENPTPPVMSGDDPQTYVSGTANSAGSGTNQTRIKDRIYLVIKANQTQDYNTGIGAQDGGATVALTDVHSYNFYFKSKHVTPQASV